MKQELIISVAFAFFVVCPRMAGMSHLITKHSDHSLTYIALLGALFSIPLLLLMVWIFGRFGAMGALVFCVLTDLCAAFFIKEIGYSAVFETLIIALFVFLGVKIAPVLTKLFIS